MVHGIFLSNKHGLWTSFTSNFDYPAILWSWVLIKRVKETSLIFSQEPNKAFLVADSYRATERNGNSISVDVTDDTIEKD